MKLLTNQAMRLVKTIQIEYRYFNHLKKSKKIQSKLQKLIDSKIPTEFRLNASNEIGLFGQLCWILELASFYHRFGIPVRFKTFSRNYNINGEDWFSDLFDQEFEASTNKFTTIHFECWDHVGIQAIETQKKSLDFANLVQRSLFPVNRKILEKVESATKDFNSRYTIGCHYRGTDKIIEAKRVSYDHFCDHIAKALKANPDAQIFIATDEQQFVSHVQNTFTMHRVIYNPCERSISGERIHSEENSKKNANRAAEALIDSISLSKCNHVIKTASLLSGWSAVFNPSLKVTIVSSPSKDFLWFPETHISSQ